MRLNIIAILALTLIGNSAVRAESFFVETRIEEDKLAYATVQYSDSGPDHEFNHGDITIRTFDRDGKQLTSLKFAAMQLAVSSPARSLQAYQIQEGIPFSLNTRTVEVSLKQKTFANISTDSCMPRAIAMLVPKEAFRNHNSREKLLTLSQEFSPSRFRMAQPKKQDYESFIRLLRAETRDFHLNDAIKTEKVDVLGLLREIANHSDVK